MRRSEIMARYDAMVHYMSEPSHWTQGTSYRDKDGFNSSLKDGYSFCIDGAIDKSFPLCPTNRNIRNKIINAFYSVTYPLSYVCWNDSPQRKHSDIMRLYKKARVILFEEKGE